MGNRVTALGIPEVSEGVVCCATSALSGIFSKCSVRQPRFAFSLFLLFGTVASFLVLGPNMRQLLDKIPYLCTTLTTDEMCDNLVGYGAVYRICFSLGLFYIIFAIAMINTTSTSDFRYKIHSGYWMLKLVLLVLILVAAFHIPRHTEFGRALMYAGLTGGFMFIIIQVLLVIDFAHSWSISWAEKVDSGNTSFWYTALAFSTILIYSAAITMAVFFYLFFTDLRNLSKCRGNMFLVTFNLSQCVLASIISVLPRVQDEAIGSGLLQSSVVSLYAMYLTWCTLSSEPDGSCNPLGDVILDYDKASGVNGQALFDCVLMFALLIFACNVRSGTSKLEKIGFSLSKISATEDYNYANTFEKLSRKSRDKNIDGKTYVEDDEQFVEYNYSYFHFVMFLASLQLMMVVTNWHSPDELADMKKLVKNWATVWIQLSSSILCVLVYIWSTVAPLLIRTWGPCLGLDYEIIPTVDDYEYGRLRRRAEAVRASDEVLERFESRKCLRKPGKSRQSTLDSGMFDTNCTRSDSRSASRATSSNVRLTASTHSETKLLGQSEEAEDINLDNSSIFLHQEYTDECRRDERIEGLQSRQSAVNKKNSNGSSLTTSCNETIDDNETSGYCPKKITIDSSGGKDDTHLQQPPTDVGDDRQLPEENRVLNQIPSTHGNVPSASSDKTSGSLKSLSLDESSSSSVGKISSGSRNDEQKALTTMFADNRSVTSAHEIKQSRPCSRGVESALSEDERNVLGSAREILLDEQCSTIDRRCQSRLSEETGNDRWKSLDQTRPDSRPPSRLMVNNRQNEKRNNRKRTPNFQSDSKSASSDESVEKRGASETVVNGRTAPDKPRGIFPKMQDHIAWVKRLRKLGENVTTSNKDFVLENKRQQSDLTGQRHSLTNDEKDKKTETRQLSVAESIQDKNKVSRQKTSMSAIAIEKENDQDNKNDDSAIFRHPFVHAPGGCAQVNGPQAPDVSKEILRLQAKILKFQAKVVKTQQHILEIQDEDDDVCQETRPQSKNRT